MASLPKENIEGGRAGRTSLGVNKLTKPSTTGNISDADFKRFVLVNLKSLRTQQIHIANDVTKLLKRQQRAPVDGEEVLLEDSTADVLIGLPAIELDHFLDFDSKLKNLDIKKKVVVALKQVGGQSLGGVVRAILHRVMEDTVARLYSYLGGKGKKRFDELNFKNVVFCSVRAHSKYEKATDGEIKEIISKWSANAKTRASSAKEKSSAKSSENLDEINDEDKDEESNSG